MLIYFNNYRKLCLFPRNKNLYRYLFLLLRIFRDGIIYDDRGNGGKASKEKRAERKFCPYSSNKVKNEGKYVKKRKIDIINNPMQWKLKYVYQ